MTIPLAADAATLDFAAAARWPARAASHVLGVGLILAVIIALPLAPTDLDRHQLPKETVVHLATWLAVLLARPVPLRGLRPAARWAVGAFLLITVVSALLASNGWLALRAASLVVTGAAAFFTARQVAAEGFGPVLLAWCAAAGVIGAGGGLAQAYGVQSSLFATTRIPGGTFGNRNFMAHFSGLVLPLLTLIALTTRRTIVVLATALGCAALAAAIILSRSRAAWLGTGAGMLTFAVVVFRARRRGALPDPGMRPILLGLMTAAGVIAAIVVPNGLAWRSASPYTDTIAGLTKYDEGSGHGRVLQYRNTLTLAMHHPLVGVGPGNWSIHYADVAPWSDPTWVLGDVIPINPWPSSDWMAMASEVGFGGVLAAILFVAAMIWRASVASRASGQHVLAGGALLALCITTFIEGNLDAVLLLPAALLLVAMASAALLHEVRSAATCHAECH